MPNVITLKPKKRCLSSSSVCGGGGDTCWFGEFGVIGSDFDPRNYVPFNAQKLIKQRTNTHNMKLYASA